MSERDSNRGGRDDYRGGHLHLSDWDLQQIRTIIKHEIHDSLWSKRGVMSQQDGQDMEQRMTLMLEQILAFAVNDPDKLAEITAKIRANTAALKSAVTAATPK